MVRADGRSQSNETFDDRLAASYRVAVPTRNVAIALLLLLLVPSAGCGSGTPWALIARSAQSELRATEQLRDRRLKSQLRRAIAIEEPGEILSVSPYVFIRHGFLVGAVPDAETHERLETAAREVSGLRDLTLHLPIEEIHDTEHDLVLLAEVKARLAARPDIVQSRVSLRVLNAHAVLLGVVRPDEQSRVVEETQKVDGITGVTNLMLAPEEGFGRRRPGLR